MGSGSVAAWGPWRQRRPRLLGERQDAAEVLVRAGDHLDADDLADPAGRRGAGVDGRLHRRHVAGHERRDQAAADLVPADQVHVRRLQHRVAGLDQGDEPLASRSCRALPIVADWPSRPSFGRVDVGSTCRSGGRSVV